MEDSVQFQLRMDPLFDAIPNCPKVLTRKYRGPHLPAGSEVLIYLKGSEFDVLTAVIKAYYGLLTNHKDEALAWLDLTDASVKYASREGVRETLLQNFHLGGWFPG